MTHVYGWKKDDRTANEVYVKNHPSFKLTAGVLPKSVDLRPHCSPVYNQGQKGSCTGNAIIGAAEYLENKDKDLLANGEFVSLSRLFVYYNERLMEGTVNEDAGAQISDGITSIMSTGICQEAFWPYIEDKWNQKPEPAAYLDASARKITAAARVSRDNGIADIKQVLASGYPIVFGFSVYEGFESEDVAATGMLELPGADEQFMGGHAVLAVGYNSSHVIVRNSWGDQWGDKGYFYMPYAYITDRNLASDLWTVTK